VHDFWVNGSRVGAPMTSRILEAAVGRVEVDNRHSATLAAYQTQMERDEALDADRFHLKQSVEVKLII